MLTYILIISPTFPKDHDRAGQATNFPEQILDGRKLHTIRHNYDHWAARFANIDAGKACLRIVMWSGKPYRSPQTTIKTLYTTDGIGLEKLEATHTGMAVNGKPLQLPPSDIAKNDGLSYPDFYKWFKGSFNFGEPKAIIHFTDFRYSA